MEEVNMEADSSKEEDLLRKMLHDKPKSAKLMSRLSCLLLVADPATDNRRRRRQEALQLAQRAIDLAPHKPFGFIAMSYAVELSPPHNGELQQRFHALQRATAILQDWSSSSTYWTLTRYTLLVRRLMEPRQVQALQKIAQAAAASPTQHPHRRGLDTREQTLYTKDILPVLDSLWNSKQHQATLSWQQLETLAQVEFRLGKFFRKKMPSSTYQPYSQHHFQNSIQGYQLSRCRQEEQGGDGLSAAGTWCSGTHRSSDVSNDMEMARFWLATTEANNDHNNNKTTKTSSTISKCPADYIVGLYASFSKRFDAVLVDKLEYQTPRKLRALLVDHLNNNTTPRLLFHNAVDLGCGTGLSGIEFRPLLQPNGLLTGIDISPAMIAMAQEKRSRVYSQLMVGDLTMAFCGSDAATHVVTQAYDLVIACDVFCYLGDLNEVFTAVQQSFLLASSSSSLAPARYFCFSTEALDDEGNNDYCLQDCARFAHKECYLQRLASHYGFSVERLERSKLRKNRGRDVMGFLAILKFE